MKAHDLVDLVTKLNTEFFQKAPGAEGQGFGFVYITSGDVEMVTLCEITLWDSEGTPALDIAAVEMTVRHRFAEITTWFMRFCDTTLETLADANVRLKQENDRLADELQKAVEERSIYEQETFARRS